MRDLQMSSARDWNSGEHEREAPPRDHDRSVPGASRRGGITQPPTATPWTFWCDLDDTVAVPMAVPARMLTYFASCADPMEYTGRLFWAERELAELGIDPDEQPVTTS